MDVLARLFAGGGLQAGTPHDADDFWYRPIGAGVMTPAGLRVDEQGAQKLSAWFRGKLILMVTLAMLPLPIYRRLPHDGGSEPALEHPLYDILHNQTNDAQDSFQWRCEKVAHLVDHGHAYDWIVPGARGFVDQLAPIDPTLVTCKQLSTTLANGARIPGREIFDVRDPQTGRSSTFTQDEIFHLRAPGGKGILEQARLSLGTALATETYAGTVFGRGTLHGGIIENPGVLDPEASSRMATSFLTAAGDWRLPKVLEQGSKFIESKMSPEDFQMLLSRKFSVDDVARWLGVPRQMLENSDPSFGNAEQFWQSFLTISMGGWLSLFEFAVNGQLILAPKTYYAQFTRQALMRGNFRERIEGLVLAAGGPILTTDEARKIEDLNKLGGKAGALRENQNVTGKPATTPAADPPPARKTPAPDPPARKKRDPDDEEDDAQAQAIITAAAARVLRKEVKAVQRYAVQHAADLDAFAIAVTDFYAAHVALVAETLQMETAEAERYCAGQAAQIVNGVWLTALETWRTPDYAAGLAALALEDAA